MEADLGKLCQSIGIIGVGLVRRHVQRCFGMSGINADRGQAFRRQGMIEPYGEWTRLEYDAPGVRRMFADHLCQMPGIGNALAAPDPL